MSCKHQGGGESLSCPVCQASLSPADLIPVERRKIEKPKARYKELPKGLSLFVAPYWYEAEGVLNMFISLLCTEFRRHCPSSLEYCEFHWSSVWIRRVTITTKGACNSWVILLSWPSPPALVQPHSVRHWLQGYLLAPVTPCCLWMEGCVAA